MGDIIKNAEVKSYSSFGCFFNVNNELDVLCHTSELSYSRVNHADELFNIGDKVDLKVISVDKEKLQVGYKCQNNCHLILLNILIIMN